MSQEEPPIPPDERPDLFSGQYTIAEALGQLRTRLLDLTSRNRLLNFRHPRGRSLQVVDADFNAAYHWLLDAKKVLFEPVPEPRPSEYEDTRPDAKTYAKTIGINTDIDLLPPRGDLPTTRGPHHLRVLHYPQDLEKLLRKLGREATAAIEETGCNILHLIFGFLEFYEAEYSDIPLFAPLLSVPVSIDRSHIDPVTRTYLYDLAYNGDDINDNLTLKEKLRLDLGLVLPEFSEHDTPESYLDSIRDLAQTKRRWRVHRRISLGMLSFAKLAIWQDLGSPSLLNHELIKVLFQGSQEPNIYDDERKDTKDDTSTLQLIYDADISQEHAISEVLKGSSLVVDGPPGTGKSQTITNIIAAAMAQSKSVLFVSEKMAALKVVRNRLEAAGLGDFCLTLHSDTHRPPRSGTKKSTPKKEFWDEIKCRMNNRYAAPGGIEDKRALLCSYKARLQRYADIMNSSNNNLNMTFHDVLWAALRRHTLLDEQGWTPVSISISDAPTCTRMSFYEKRDLIEQLATEFAAADTPGDQPGWTGFYPRLIMPDDEASIRLILEEHLAHIDNVHTLQNALAAVFGRGHVTRAFSDATLEALEDIGAPPRGLDASLLPRFFSKSDPNGSKSAEIITELAKRIADAKESEDVVTAVLLPHAMTLEIVTAAEEEAAVLARNGLDRTPLEQLNDLLEKLSRSLLQLNEALRFFTNQAAVAHIQFSGSLEDIFYLHCLTEIACNTPVELLAYRHATLSSPGAEHILKQCRAERDKLFAEKERLEGRFQLDNLPETSVLERAVRSLRETGWFKWFRAEWRAARRLYHSLAKGPDVQSKPYESLGRLLKWIKDTDAFARNAKYKEIFGDHFNGMDTDIDSFARLIQWYRSSVDALAVFPTKPAHQFLESDTHIFRLLSAKAEEFDHVWNMFHNSLDSVKSLTPDKYPQLVDDHAQLTAVSSNIQLELAVWTSAVHSLARLANNSASPAQIIKALRAKLQIDIITHKAEQFDDAEALLGDKFRGRLTDMDTASEAHDWGRRVIAACRESGTCLHDLLLCPEVRERYLATKGLLDRLKTAWHEATSLNEKLSQYGSFSWSSWLPKDGPADRDWQEYRDRAQRALKAIESLLAWSRYAHARDAAIASGLRPFCDLLEAASLPSDIAVPAFEYSFYTSIIQHVLAQEPELSGFSSSAHELLRTKYMQLDREVIRLNGQMFSCEIDSRKQVPRGVMGGRVKDYTERCMLERESGLARPRTPIRQIIRKAGRALKAYKPCFMMSPLAVAQYIEPGSLYFDIIIMDEASQLKPEEALGAVSRGRQVVIVGDPKQLPPTAFFDRLVSYDDEDEGTQPAISTTESILDVCTHLFPKRRLRWHYRSRHESLIAFSNYHFYKDLLIFPSPYQTNPSLGVRYNYVEKGSYTNRQNLPEAYRVVEAVTSHMRTSSDESLGVVTLNMTQRDLIEEILDRRLRDLPEGEAYRDKWQREGWPLFVKNLENVQGDERDVIFISTTFGLSPGTTRVRQNFGPISRPNGWRRLNVLFTRARNRLVVFSSMQPEDIIIDESTPEGTKTLRYYLEYARDGYLRTLCPKGEPDSDFEVSVGEVLEKAGYQIAYQLGVSGYFLDIAVRHTSKQGDYLAAIECDGASYHSGVSVRDRDRIRQEILESLGWKGKIYRIWSTDWYRNRVQEIRKLLAYLADKQDTSSYKVKVTPLEESVDHVSQILTGEAPIVQPISHGEELFVEVGDTVTYCDVETPFITTTVRIMSGHNNVREGIIDETKPLSRALLGAIEGEEVTLSIPLKPIRTLRILKIRREIFHGQSK
jgi:transcription elongation GreA/GreB family factor